MATILIIGKTHIRSAKTPQHDQNHVIYGSGQHAFLIRLLFNRYFGFSRNGIAATGSVAEPYDLLHCLNNIPITKKPWIVTFEDILPRTFGRKGKLVAKLIRPRLLADNCRKILGQSKYAVKKLAKANKDWEGLKHVLAKTTVIYPSINIKYHAPKVYRGGPINMVFCGRAFARKGGVSAVRLAKLAQDCGLPLTMHIVSDLKLNSYTDATDARKYAPDLELINLPNVIYHKSLENQKVLELFRKCEFQYMPTIADTFGFSIVEGLSMGTPAIVTNTCAMPEIIEHGDSGHLLDLEVNEENDITWLRGSWDIEYRGTDMYWEHLDTTYSNLALQTLEILERIIAKPSEYETLSAGALLKTARQHDSKKMSEAYSQLYKEVLGVS